MPNINDVGQWQYPGGQYIAPSQAPLSDWSQQDKSNMGRDYGNDSIAAAMWGNANAPPDVYFGGTPDAANMASKYYQNMGNATFGNAAPQIGSMGQNAIKANRVMANDAFNNAQANSQFAAGQQNAALGNLALAASGKGPSAAQAQLQAGTDAGIQAQMAMANSARGQAGIANAQKNASTQGAGMLQSSANQAAQLRAQEMQAAQAQYMQGANQMQNQYGQQALGFQGQGLQGAGMLQQGDISQAGFQAGQNALNQQGQMGYEQMAFNAQMAAMQAAQANQQARLDLNKHNADKANDAFGGIMNSIGGAAMLSDMRAKTDVKDAGEEIDAALGKMGAYSYEYKNPGMLGALHGRQVGTMAQQLKKSEAGARLIDETNPDGFLRVKMPEATSFLLGAVSHLNKKIEDIAAMKFGGSK